MSSAGARSDAGGTTAATGLSVVTEEPGSGEGTSSATTTRERGGDSGAMDVSIPREKPDEVHSKDSMVGHSFILESLSQQLQLDNLWHALSECLDMLAQTSDPHAVLILQPTVEAFFLVHATNADECKPGKKSRSAESRSRSLGQLSMFRAGSESGDPASPAPRMDFSPVPSTPGLAKGEDSYSHLPPDTARFLMFAGKLDSLSHTHTHTHTHLHTYTHTILSNSSSPLTSHRKAQDGSEPDLATKHSSPLRRTLLCPRQPHKDPRL